MNQVVATVYARFHRKKLPEGRAVHGVFTRDYRSNTLNSQVTKEQTLWSSFPCIEYSASLFNYPKSGSPSFIALFHFFFVAKFFVTLFLNELVFPGRSLLQFLSV